MGFSLMWMVLCKAQVCIGHKGAFQGVQRVKRQRLSQCSMGVTYGFVQTKSSFIRNTCVRPSPLRFRIFCQTKPHSSCVYRLATAVTRSVDLKNKNVHISIETTINISKDALLFYHILQYMAVAMHLVDESASRCRTDHRPTDSMQKTVLQVYRPLIGINGMASLPSHAIMRLFSTSTML